MTRFIAAAVFGAMIATPVFCFAGDTPNGKEKKTAKASSSTKPRSVTIEQQPIHGHPNGTAFCRRGDYYCVRAASSPWWPNVPGD